MTTFGIIGAGHIGTALAQAATDAGYDVVLSNSRGPETLADLVDALGDRPSRRGSIRAATAAEAGAAGDLVVVTVPVKAVPDVPVEPLAGKVVIDTNNYYPQRDGHIVALDDGTTTSSELLQQHLPSARVVKAFNHIPAAQITARRAPAGTPNRRALAIAGDDASAKEVVASFIDEIGFDVLDLDAGRMAEATAAATRRGA
jgi:8-hydroxy-5-deazaflavin:NADPH oxidoreductase